MATLDTVIIPLASIFKLDLMVIMLRGGGRGKALMGVDDSIGWRVK